MTEPLTPEEARELAGDIKGSVETTFNSQLTHRLFKTLLAYADQSERLKEMEAAVENVIAAADAQKNVWEREMPVSKRERFLDEAKAHMSGAIHRLRSLMEKK